MKPHNRFDNAVRIANGVHFSQLDKGRAPYILHPMRVANAVWFSLPITGMHTDLRPVAACVAMLHDVLEDCLPEHRVYHEDLIATKCGLDVLRHVQLLTRDPVTDPELDKHWHYAQYICRLARNRDMGAICRLVKECDLIDNLRPDRDCVLSAEHRLRYTAALDFLRALPRGDALDADKLVIEEVSS
jgi:(p)ppGpp synthase/HD superfamily hydrolase